MPRHGYRDLDEAAVRDGFAYDQQDGIVRWAVTRNGYGGGVYPGKPAGTMDRYGYLATVFMGNTVPNHILAWFLHHGEWPPRGMQIDHHDLDPLNNRIDNLRLATRAQQRANQFVRKDSQLGVKGVRRTNGGRYEARFRNKRVGVFDSVEAASQAYANAAGAHFGEYSRHG